MPALALAAACGDDASSSPDAGVDSTQGQADAMTDAEVVDLTSCVSDVGSAGGFVELCKPEQGGPVRHVRIDSVMVAATHASAQIVFGFDAPPASAQATLEPDQFRVLFYGGGTPAPAPQIEAAYGVIEESFEGERAWVNTGAAVCFDLHAGSDNTAPAFVLWVDGIRGADCEVRSTLTLASAYGVRSLWKGASGAIAMDAKIYFRQSTGAAPTVHLSSQAVLDAATIAAAASCTSTPAATTDWQAMCVPGAGRAKHVRIENASATANNSYFYAVLGEEANPTGNPTTNAGKLIITGGRSSSGASWTWFRFGTGSTGQFSYATDAASALYTDAPSTICFDVGESDQGTARVLFWATGANGANCADHTTLTLDNVLYDSTTDETTGDIWNAPLVDGKLNFVKLNNDTSSLGTVHVTSETAVL